MKYPLIAATLICAISASGAATAQQVSGEVTFGLARNAEQSNNSKRVTSSVAFPLYGQLGLQVDVGVGKFEDTFSTAPYAGLHLTYELAPDWQVGGFLAGDDTRPGNYFYYGFEVAHDIGDVRFETYLSGIDVIKSRKAGIRYGGEMIYGLTENVSLVAGGNAQMLEGDDRAYGYLGGAYSFDNGITTTLTVGQTDQGDTITGAMLTLPFGERAGFGTRDTRSLFPAYDKP